MALRPIKEAEVPSLIPKNVLNEMGTTFGERWTLKNYSANPSAARRLLQDMGYAVMEYGSSTDYNFAVKKIKIDPETGQEIPLDPNEPWRLVDPSGAKDFLFDLRDLVGDAFVGMMGSLGFTGGLLAGGAGGMGVGAVPGAIVGGGLMSGFAEGARQIAGHVSGMRGNIDPMGVVGATAGGAMGGALGPAMRGAGGAIARGPIGRTTSKLVTGAGQLSREIGGKVAGIKSFDALSAGESLESVARDYTRPTLLEAAEFAKAALKKVFASGFEEKKIVESIIKKNSRTLIDVTEPFNILKNFDPEDLIATQEAAEKMAKVIKRSLAAIKLDPKVRYKRLLVPAPQADELKLGLQALAAVKKAYRLQGAGGMDAKIWSNVKHAAGVLNGRLREKLGPEYAAANDTLHLKAMAKDVLAEKLEQFRGESFVRNLFRDAKGELRGSVKEFDRLFKTNLYGMFRRAAAAADIPTDMRRFLPMITAMGSFRGLAIGGALTGGFVGGGLAGGPAGAMLGLGGAAVGLGASSPAGVLALTRAGMGIGTAGLPKQLVSGALGKLGAIAAMETVPAPQRAAAIALFRETAKQLLPEDRPVVKQDAKRKELEGE